MYIVKKYPPTDQYKRLYTQEPFFVIEITTIFNFTKLILRTLEITYYTGFMHPAEAFLHGSTLLYCYITQ